MVEVSCAEIDLVYRKFRSSKRAEIIESSSIKTSDQHYHQVYPKIRGRAKKQTGFESFDKEQRESFTYTKAHWPDACPL